jgi:hypothetical protein
MVFVNEQMTLDLKQAQLGLLNNSDRSSLPTTSAASIANTSKLQKVTAPSASRSTSNVNTVKPIAKASQPPVLASGQATKRALTKLVNVSFEDEELDMDMTRAGFELYEAIRNQRFR